MLRLYEHEGWTTELNCEFSRHHPVSLKKVMRKKSIKSN
jgi:hypothetical protein